MREFCAGGKIIVTTLRCLKDALKAMLKALYRSRWNVELGFRDVKSQHLGEGLERSRSRSAGRFTVLVLIASLAILLLWLLGTATSDQQFDQRLRPGSRNRRAYLRVFLARLLLTLDACQALLDNLWNAIHDVDQWVARDHNDLLSAPAPAA